VDLCIFRHKYRSEVFLLAKICGYEVLDIYRGYKGDKEDLFENEVYPIVYAYIDGVEKFSFVPYIYSGEQWFEIMPADASKSNAIKQCGTLRKNLKIIH